MTQRHKSVYNLPRVVVQLRPSATGGRHRELSYRKSEAHPFIHHHHTRYLSYLLQNRILIAYPCLSVINQDDTNTDSSRSQVTSMT